MTIHSRQIRSQTGIWSKNQVSSVLSHSVMLCVIVVVLTWRYHCCCRSWSWRGGWAPSTRWRSRTWWCCRVRCTAALDWRQWRTGEPWAWASARDIRTLPTSPPNEPNNHHHRHHHHHLFIYYAPPVGKGVISVTFVCPSVCPSVTYMANNSRTQRLSVPKFGRRVPTFDATCTPVSRSQSQKSRSPGPLMLTHIVRHTFQTARHTNCKLGIGMENDDPHQPQAPWSYKIKD